MTPHRRQDGVLVWKTEGVDCTVKPFCTQDGAPFEWQCVIGVIGPHAQLRATGSAENEAEAIETASKYAKTLNYMYFTT